MLQQLADSLDTYIGGRILRQRLGIAGVMSLPHENGGDARPPDLLDRAQNAQFVVHDHIMLGRKPLLDVIELLFLMDINEGIAVEDFIESGTKYLVRLEDHV